MQIRNSNRNFVKRVSVDYIAQKTKLGGVYTHKLFKFTSKKKTWIKKNK